jgi:hypothetical protein
MNYLEIGLSIMASIVSIFFAIKAKQEKEECIKIKTEISNFITNNSLKKSIKTEDEFNINRVQVFDNSKRID